MTPYHSLPIQHRSTLMNEYRKNGYSYHQAIADFNSTLPSFKSGGKYDKNGMPLEEDGTPSEFYTDPFTTTVDKFGNTLQGKVQEGNYYGRSNYNDKNNTINLSAFGLYSAKEGNELLAHENYHAHQDNIGALNFDIAHNTPNRQLAELTRKPSIPDRNELFSNYNDRKGREVEMDADAFRKNNIGSDFINTDILFRKSIDKTIYNNPYSSEGEAKLYQKTGKDVNGNVVKFATGGTYSNLPGYAGPGQSGVYVQPSDNTQVATKQVFDNYSQIDARNKQNEIDWINRRKSGVVEDHPALEMVSPEFAIMTGGVGSGVNLGTSIAGKIGSSMIHGAGQGAMANIANIGSEQSISGLATDMVGGALVGGALRGAGVNIAKTTRPIRLANSLNKEIGSTRLDVPEIWDMHTINKNRKNPFEFKNIGDKPHWWEGYTKEVTPETIDLNSGFKAYADAKNAHSNTAVLADNVANSLGIRNGGKESVFNTMNKIPLNYEETVPFGKRLGNGIEGVVHEFKNYPDYTIKFGQPNGMKDVINDEVIENLSKFRKYGNIAVPLKTSKLFKVKDMREYQATIMDNLNNTKPTKLDLSDRDRYALFLKQVRSLKSNGFDIDTANPDNFKFNENKGVYDIYDLSKSTQSTDRIQHYLPYVNQQLRQSLLTNREFFNSFANLNK